MADGDGGAEEWCENEDVGDGVDGGERMESGELIVDQRRCVVAEVRLSTIRRH
jgi:hypothetical protein